jgi:hypothetical protein
VHHHLIGHVLLGWGFWLSGIAIGYIAAKRGWRRATYTFAVECARQVAEARAFAVACSERVHEPALETTVDVDLGPWIEQCREPGR